MSSQIYLDLIVPCVSVVFPPLLPCRSLSRCQSAEGWDQIHLVFLSLRLWGTMEGFR